VINHLVIIGVGLIGSSLALALRQAGYVKHITGSGRSEANLKKGVELGIIDDYNLSVTEAVIDADVIVVATPLGAMLGIFEKILPGLSSKSVITDVGSVKGSVVKDARLVFGKQFPQFVAGHPIAGTEQSGVEAGFATLYKNRKVILTPDQDTDSQALETVNQMWQATGAQVECMDISHHDLVLAATSHLPHMLAFSLVSHLSKMTDQDEIFDYAAGGFRDFTRIASSDPVMWRDICMANGDALVELIEGYKIQLDQISIAIRDENPDALYELFKDAKHTRDQLRHI
jgi:prephenate dehydrogenase